METTLMIPLIISIGFNAFAFVQLWLMFREATAFQERLDEITIALELLSKDEE